MSQATAQKPPLTTGAKGPVTKVGESTGTNGVAPAAAKPDAPAAPVKAAESPLKGNAESVPAAAVTPTKAPKRHAAVPRLRLEGYLHNRFDFSVERGISHTELLSPDYWMHVAAQFKPGDTIIARSEDGTWRYDLEVVNADRLWAKVHPLGFWDFTKTFADMPKTQEEEYDTLWNAVDKYFIVKKGQENMPALKTGFTTKLEAYQWLDGHLKALNK